MPYPTQTDLDNALSETLQIQLTDDEKHGVKHAGRLEATRLAAVSLFEDYAKVRHTVPIATPSASVNDAIVTLWIFNLYKRRPLLGMPQMVIDAKDAAMRYLRDIADGRAQLGGAVDLPSSTAASQGAVLTNSEESDWSRDNLKDY